MNTVNIIRALALVIALIALVLSIISLTKEAKHNA